MNKKILVIIIAAVVAVAAAVTGVVVYNSTKDEEKAYRVLKVKSFEGNVNLTRRDEDMDVFEGMKLKNKDTVTTGSSSLIEILADSDKHIVADENTRFSIKAKGSEKDGKIEIDLEYGSSLFEIENKLNEDSEFKVKTPNATASVRGTKFRVTYYPDRIETVVNVFEGIVEVTSSISEVDVEAGQTVIINSIGEIFFVNDESGDESDDGGNEGVDGGGIRANTPKHLEDTEFQIFYWMNSDKVAGIWAKQLEGWDKTVTEQNGQLYNELRKDGLVIRYYVMSNEEYRTFTNNIMCMERNTYTNGDGVEVIFGKYDYQGNYEPIRYAYTYTKVLNAQEKLMVYIYDEVNGDILETTNIEDYIDLTMKEYYADTMILDGEAIDGAQNPDNMSEQELLDYVKGDIEMRQLDVLLEIAVDREVSILSNNTNIPTYATLMLNKIYHTQTSGEYFDANGVRNDGTTFDLAEINEVLSVLTDEEINEDNIWTSMSINDNNIFFSTCDVTRGGWTSADITNYYMEEDEIIVEFTFNKTNGSADINGTKGTAKAYLVTNSDDEYIIDRIEIVAYED